MDSGGDSNLPQLKLVADEEAASQVSKNLLVGKVISGKLVNRNVVQMIIRRVWFTNELVDIEQVEPNLFVFSFKNSYDRNRIWNRRPWSVNGAHLLLKEWSPTVPFQDLEFHKSAFWVQIHGLTLCFMTKVNAEKIGGIFPTVLSSEISSRTNFTGKRYMCIQVEVDLRQPIPSGFTHTMAGRKL